MNECRLNNIKFPKKYCFSLYQYPKTCYIIKSNHEPGQQCATTLTECQKGLGTINQLLNQKSLVEKYKKISDYNQDASR